MLTVSVIARAFYSITFYMAFVFCTAVFSSMTRDELNSAVKECLWISPTGDCQNGWRGPIGEWDVSRVTDMTQLFLDARAFNQELSKWDVSRATDMGMMFANATHFNEDLSKWDVSRVTAMSSIFGNAELFNQDLSHWNVGHVTSMRVAFLNAKSFNQDLSQWDVSHVTEMMGNGYVLLCEIFQPRYFEMGCVSRHRHARDVSPCDIFQSGFVQVEYVPR